MNNTTLRENESATDIVTAAELTPFGPSRHHYARAVRAGTMRRLRRGIYVAEQDWAALSTSEQQLQRLLAVAMTRSNEPVFSHASAAIIHGLPLVHEESGFIHVLAAEGAPGRSRNGVIEHERPRAGDVVRSRGLLATCVSRTVVDLAATRSPLVAVAAADAAIHIQRFGSQAPQTTKEELFAAWERMLPLRGHARARSVIEFADARAESPLESISRLSIHKAGFPPPVLQWALSDADGFIGEVDFAWPEFGIVGEADGEAKYLDSTLRGGRSAERVVIDEKYREDRIRALGYRVARWGWREAKSAGALEPRLRSVGLPSRSSR